MFFQKFQERFIELLAKLAYGQAVFDKRKTLQLRDLGNILLHLLIMLYTF